MSTGLIIAIVVVVLLLLALLLFVLPRARARSRERDLERRRGEVAGAHRDQAETRQVRAQEAEHVAERERAEANLHETRARMHERGLADDDLDREHESVREGGDVSTGAGLDSDRDAGGVDRGGASSGDASDFERGREVGHEEAGGARSDDRV
jgi:type II secretory pathway pseudopilin PulG